MILFLFLLVGVAPESELKLIQRGSRESLRNPLTQLSSPTALSYGDNITWINTTTIILGSWNNGGLIDTLKYSQIASQYET